MAACDADSLAHPESSRSKAAAIVNLNSEADFEFVLAVARPLKSSNPDSPLMRCLKRVWRDGKNKPAC